MRTLTVAACVIGLGCGAAASEDSPSASAAPHAVKKFVVDYPASLRLASADGQRLTHASGFAADTGTERPEDAARRFLSQDAHGGAFGVTASQALVVKATPVVGGSGQFASSGRSMAFRCSVATWWSG